MLKRSMVLLGLVIAGHSVGHADFQNGDFELPLTGTWVQTGTQMGLVAGGDADADVEARLYWSYQTVAPPYSGSTVNSSIEQTTTVADLATDLTFKRRADITNSAGGAGQGSVDAVVEAQLLDAGNLVLTTRQWNSATAWETVTVNLQQWADAEGLPAGSVAAVRFSAQVSGVAPVKPDWYVGTTLFVDDVHLTPVASGVADWALFQ